MLDEGLAAAHPEDYGKCFFPRHGLRIVQGGKTRDYVICFQCAQFLEYVDGERVRDAAIRPEPGADYTARLTAAGIPVLPDNPFKSQ